MKPLSTAGMIPAGLVFLAIALERLVSAALVDGLASFESSRFLVATLCACAGGLMVLAAVVTRPRRR